MEDTIKRVGEIGFFPLIKGEKARKYAIMNVRLFLILVDMDMRLTPQLDTVWVGLSSMGGENFKGTIDSPQRGS